jgi:hypothetical protein
VWTPSPGLATDVGRRLGAPARCGTGSRRRGWGSRCQRETERACTRTGVRALERPSARTTGWNDTTEGGTSARHGETPASSARPRNRNKGWGLIPFLSERVRGCTSAWTQARVRACTCRGLGHGDSRDNGGVATTGKDESENKEKGWLAGLRARRRRQRHLQEAFFLSLARWLTSHSACAAASWARRSCPWLNGRASQRGGSTVPHLSGHGPKHRRR